MKYVGPSKISGVVKAPPSKSMMQRAVAAALLNEGTSRIVNPSFCEDAIAAIRVAASLGAEIRRDEGFLVVKGGLRPTGGVLDCGESGLCIRMFCAIAALCETPLTLSGEGSLRSRLVMPSGQVLEALGAKCDTNGGFPPLRVRGPLRGGTALMNGSAGSQLLTGLLMALPLAPNDSRLVVERPTSTPYIDMTLRLLRHVGIEIHQSGHGEFFIKGNQRYRMGEYLVEGDWSGASFLLVAGAIGGYAMMAGLDYTSPQGDKAVVQVLRSAGADVKVSEAGVEVRQRKLKAFTFDATDCPDLFPPLVALACNCDGTSLIAGIKRLETKESNRAVTLVKEFSSLGAHIRIVDDVMAVGGTKIRGGTAFSHGDHRIAMALAVAALAAEGTVFIENHECISKSYPEFFNDLNLLGGSTGG